MFTHGGYRKSTELFRKFDTLGYYGIYNKELSTIPDAIKFSIDLYARDFDRHSHSDKDKKTFIDLIKSHESNDDDVIVPFIDFFSGNIDVAFPVILCERHFFSIPIKILNEIEKESENVDILERIDVSYAQILTESEIRNIKMAVEGRHLLDWDNYVYDDTSVYVEVSNGRESLWGKYLLDKYLWKIDRKKTKQLDEEQIRLLLLEKIDSERKKWERLRNKFSGIAGPSFPKRQLISEDVRIFVWRRDGGKCVSCGGQEKLEYDHIIPVSRGGSNTERNIQLLCEKCNRLKGGKIQ